jgi:hypothetical protein
LRTSASVISAIVGLLLIANGLWMLVGPLKWFAATPIVWRTGVPNEHFIRDVGWIYGAVGALIFGGLVRPTFRAQSLKLAIVWLAGHAAIHIGEVATGICSPPQFALQTPQVMGPLILLLLAAGLEAARPRRQSS